MNTKTLFIIGGVFGLIAPIVGLFVGLQVSTTLGTILSFPLIILSYAANSPFGSWQAPTLIGGWFFSVIAWALIFAVVGKIIAVVRMRG